MGSAEEASSHLQMFAWHIPLTPSHLADMQRDPAQFQLPQPVVPDGKLPNLGDENHVWSKYDESGSSQYFEDPDGNVLRFGEPTAGRT